MFQIIHDKHLVYSLIKVRELKKPLFQGEQPIEDLMFLWANQTAIPYIKYLWYRPENPNSVKAY